MDPTMIKSNKHPLTFAILGCGVAATIHADAINQLEGAALKGVFDPNISSRQTFSEKYNIKNFIYAGGVSCSQYMRQYLMNRLTGKLNIALGRSELSSDNAVGVALLGGKHIWR